MPAEPIPLVNSDLESRHLPMVYILGNSHSGSTLLSFLLASNPHIINLGEIKSKTWLKQRFCSCGQPVESCSFYENYFAAFNSLKEAALQKIRTGTPIRLMFKGKIKTDNDTRENVYKLHNSISNNVIKKYPDAAFWIDASKSIWLLNAWLQVVPQEEIKILWVRRQLKANVSSFVKRGSSFLVSLLTIKFNNMLTSRFLKKNNLTWLEVNYDQFYDSYHAEAKAMSAFLGLEIPDTYSAHPNHHVISGNRMTRQSFTKQFEGLRKDDEWQHILSGFQKKILSWLS